MAHDYEEKRGASCAEPGCPELSKFRGRCLGFQGFMV